MSSREVEIFVHSVYSVTLKYKAIYVSQTHTQSHKPSPHSDKATGEIHVEHNLISRWN